MRSIRHLVGKILAVRMSSSVWKRVAVLVVVALLPVSALAHAKLFYRMSCKSDYRKVEVTSTPEPTLTSGPTEIPLVEILLESTMTPEPTLTPMPTETATEVPTSMPEDAEKPSDQITTQTDISTTPQEIV